MNVLIDTNILLDVLLDRQPWVTEASQIWAACETRRITGFIPASAMTDIFYVARRTTDLATAQIAVGLCLATFAIASVVTRNPADFTAAPIPILAPAELLAQL